MALMINDRIGDRVEILRQQGPNRKGEGVAEAFVLLQLDRLRRGFVWDKSEQERRRGKDRTCCTRPKDDSAVCQPLWIYAVPYTFTRPPRTPLAGVTRSTSSVSIALKS